MVRVVEVPVCNDSCMGVGSWVVLGSVCFRMSTVVVVALYVPLRCPWGGVVVPYIVVVHVVSVLVSLLVPCTYLCLGSS